jgi:hypothetical protein
VTPKSLHISEQHGVHDEAVVQRRDVPARQSIRVGERRLEPLPSRRQSLAGIEISEVSPP